MSLHTGGRETLIGPHELKVMKNTAYLVNASRGVNVDEDALYDALKNGEIGGAAWTPTARSPSARASPSRTGSWSSTTWFSAPTWGPPPETPCAARA